MENKEELFCVFKLLTKIAYKNPLNPDKEIEQTLEGCAGYLPVFDNYDDALEESCDGKYDIIVIKPKEKTMGLVN